MAWTLELHLRAVDQGLVSSSERDRLRFVARPAENTHSTNRPGVLIALAAVDACLGVIRSAKMSRRTDLSENRADERT